MLIQRQTELSAHIVAFGRFLRTKGFPITTDREADALRSLCFVDIGKESDFFLSLRAIFPQTIQQLRAFDALYVAYWKELDKAVDSKIKDQENQATQKKKKQQPSSEAAFEALKNWLHNKQNTEPEELASYSLGEPLSQKDFGSYTDADMYDAQRIIRLLVQRIQKTNTRSYVASANGKRLDLRQILRQNFRAGDEIFQLYYKQPQRNKIRLVLLCDVSKSMDLYSRFWVQFMFAFQNLYRSIETFVFSTQLFRITEDLREMDYTKALENIREQVPSWSGGTDIGQALQTFVDDFGIKKLNARTIVLIISDGWDTGECTDISKNMQRIAARARRVFWLNPLASNPDYKPETKALKAILPHISALLPAHNLESLRQVVDSLH
jgi:uncharacterized protein